MFADFIGALAALISITLFLPQAAHTLKHRANAQALAGISTGTQYLIIANALCWALLGYMESNVWIALPGALNAPLAILTLILIYRSHRERVPPPTS